MTPEEIRKKVQAYALEAVRVSKEEGQDADEDIAAVLANLYLAMDALHKNNLEDACDELAEAEAILFESDDEDVV